MHIPPLHLRNQIFIYSYWYREQALQINSIFCIFSSTFTDHCYKCHRIDLCIIYNIWSASYKGLRKNIVPLEKFTKNCISKCYARGPDKWLWFHCTHLPVLFCLILGLFSIVFPSKHHLHDSYCPPASSSSSFHLHPSKWICSPPDPVKINWEVVSSETLSSHEFHKVQ